jgi:hypothetical protein
LRTRSAKKKRRIRAVQAQRRQRAVQARSAIQAEHRFLAARVALLDARLRTLEEWQDTLQRAAVENPDAIREIALVALARKVEPT